MLILLRSLWRSGSDLTGLHIGGVLAYSFQGKSERARQWADGTIQIDEEAQDPREKRWSGWKGQIDVWCFWRTLSYWVWSWRFHVDRIRWRTLMVRCGISWSSRSSFHFQSGESTWGRYFLGRGVVFSFTARCWQRRTQKIDTGSWTNTIFMLYIRNSMHLLGWCRICASTFKHVHFERNCIHTLCYFRIEVHKKWNTYDRMRGAMAPAGLPLPPGVGVVKVSLLSSDGVLGMWLGVLGVLVVSPRWISDEFELYSPRLIE